MKFLSLLFDPYPGYLEAGRQGKMTLFFSLFVVLFLFVFQPFGIRADSPAELLLLCAGYGVVCAAAMALNFYLLIPAFPSYFEEECWTVGRQLLWTCWILICIGLGNSIYSYVIGLNSFTLKAIVSSTTQVVLVGIFPVGALVLFDYLRLFRRHSRKAEQLQQRLHAMTKSDTLLILDDENNKEQLRLKLDELLFITSADNYVEVVYLANATLKRTLLRGTLKRVEQQLAHPDIVRCHRSYIVNLLNLMRISGNAQGYRLHLRGTETEIPVSRSYADRVLKKIEQ